MSIDPNVNYEVDRTKLRTKPTVTILAGDGGGVRGMIPAMVLQDIEKRTENCTAKLFDIMGGTSTGSIVTQALNVPEGPDKPTPKYRASDVVTLFKEEARVAFPQSWWDKMPYVFWLRNAKYAPDGLEGILQKYMGDTFLRNGVTECIIPTYELHGRPWYFGRHTARSDVRQIDLKIKDVVRAATAAPTYFAPKPLMIGGEQYAFIDAAIYQNNPALKTYLTAQQLFGCENDVLICSLGTGTDGKPIPYHGPRGWGIDMWAPKILDMCLLATSQAVDEELSLLFPQTAPSRQYFRFQTRITEDHAEIDDASKKNMDYLQECGTTLIEERDEDLRYLSKKLETLAEQKQENAS